MSDGNVIDWRNAKRRSQKAKARATKTPTSRATVAPISALTEGKEPGQAPEARKEPEERKETEERKEPEERKATGASKESRRAKKPNASNQEKAARRRRARGLTLCRVGRHRWEVDNSLPFDVTGGKLVTRRRCHHCGKTRVDLD